MTVLLSPAELKQALPLSDSLKKQIQAHRMKICNLLENREQILVVVGPCSIHDYEGAILYASRLASLLEKVSSLCYLVMRVYIEKPRTISGWKGFLYQPDLKKPPDLREGFYLSRKLCIEIASLGIPIAMEFVDPMTAYFFDDIISWGAIGARTCTSQVHRQIASYLPCPVGFKNSVDGNIKVAMQAMQASFLPQTFLGITEEGRMGVITSEGNPHTHIVLRGGSLSTNYDVESLKSTYELTLQYGRPTPVLIDCGHGNSQRDLANQKEVFRKVINYRLEASDYFLGVMLESYLKEGSQKVSFEVDPHLSVTDPCLSFGSTEALLLETAEKLSFQVSTLASF